MTPASQPDRCELDEGKDLAIPTATPTLMVTNSQTLRTAGENCLHDVGVYE